MTLGTRPSGGNHPGRLAACALALGLAAAPVARAATVSPQATPAMDLKRDTLTTGVATGTPAGGTFSVQSVKDSGTTIGTLMSSGATSNPNMLSMPDPANPSGTGAPSPGGLGTYTVTYTANGMAVLAKTDDPFHIPVFGFSCYYTALESDWGVVGPKTCKSLKLSGTTYSGTITNPYGYPGTYCSSFIAEVKLQGSATTNAGDDIQYNNGVIMKVASIKSADGSAVVAGKTVARDRAIIPARNSVHVDADNVGKGLLANDTGGAIKSYRLDFYKGAGVAACSGFSNVMAISACTPKQAACPGYAVP
jgi:3D (Asp-Asp-Asp) domain-containing protein